MTIQQINLFNPDFVPRRDLATARYVGWGLALVLVMAIVGAGFTHYSAAALVAQEQKLARETDALRVQTDALALQLGARKVDAALEKQLHERRTLIQARQRVAQWLRADGAGDTQGVSEFLRALARQTLDGVWLTGFSVDSQRGQLRIEGRALKSDLVPRYLGQLGSESLLKGRAFSSVELDTADARRPEASSASSELSFRLETAVAAKGARP